MESRPISRSIKTRASKVILNASSTDVRPAFSSQEYEDKEWEASVLENIENQPKASQGSSQYDDPELISLMQSLEM
jgi:hypothetical protein